MAASVELLKAARAKIADPANWTRRHWARDILGARIAARSDRACAWCARGAIVAVTPRGSWPYDEEAELARVSLQYFNGREIAHINDRLGHAAVMRLYDLAIAAAEASNA